jgi:protein-tyrosine phosphatase
MNTSCYFIKEKALFGSFPSQSAVDELENELNVRYFIDLTYSDEKKITPYKTKYSYMNYPINDRHVPQDLLSFTKFIIKVSKIIKDLKKEETIYIHCKGGQYRPK